MCLYDVFSLILTKPIPIKYRGPIKETSHLRPVYLIGQDPSVSKSSKLHIDIFRVFFIDWRNVLYVLLK